MIKRANKATALLLAAAAVVSLAPATGVSAATRLGTKEGNITSAIAFDGGKYIFEGYKTDDDDTGIYFNGGSKDSLIEDLEDYKIVGKYGTKYAFAKDGNDEYLVDLSTGKIVDDETDEEKRDSVQAKLRSTLKKTDRYENTTSYNDVTIGDRVAKGQFGDVWYNYSAKGDSYQTTSAAVSAKIELTMPTEGTLLDKVEAGVETIKVFGQDVVIKDRVYSDVEAEVKTVVASNITDYTGSWDGNVWTLSKDGALNNTELNALKTLAAKSGDVSLKVVNGKDAVAANTAVKYVGFVNENGKYIDASNVANMSIYIGNGKTKKVAEYNEDEDGVLVSLEKLEAVAQDSDYIYAIATVNVEGAATDAPTTQYFLQKISKAQGDKKDGAYVPKSVSSYQLDNGLLFDNDDAHEAVEVLEDAVAISVVNGNIYVVTLNSDEDEVTVTELKLKKTKTDTLIDDKKADVYLVTKNDDEDQDIVNGLASISIDVDGNVWALDKGAIYKFDGIKKTQMFTCDRSLDSLDVYNEGSLVVWDSNGDAYTTVQEGKAATEEEAGEVVEDTVVKTGWDQLADGSWNLYDATGAKVTGWANVGGTWYYMDKITAVMRTGWLNDNGTWYYLNSDGSMKTGWLNDNGTWYYLNSNGSMAANTTVDGYVLNASGAWVR